jgi:hypothetical protein
VLGSSNLLTGSGNERLDNMQRATSPGMADWVDIDGSNHCASCRLFWKRHCQLYMSLMRSRLKNPKFLEPKLPHGQRACRKYEKAHGAGAFSRAPQGDSNIMVSVKDTYGLPSKQLFKAADLQGRDLVLQIDGVEFGHPLGDSGKTVDILHFTNSEKALSLNSTNAHIIASLLGDETNKWPGGWIAIFHDPTVKFEDKVTGGIRVRPYAPKPEHGEMPTKEPGSPMPVNRPLGDGKQAGRPSFNDEIPF